MELLVKKLNENAVLPLMAHVDDAGYDITAIDNGTIEVEEFEVDSTYLKMLVTSVGGNPSENKIYRVKYIEYKTGLSIAPPIDYHLEFVARSSISKYDLILANCLAIGDEGYRGEYRLRFRILPLDIKVFPAKNKEEALSFINQYIKNNNIKLFNSGERIAQMLIRKTIRADMVVTDALIDTERGSGGFGSTKA